jgi:AraC-like DNA-binding protein
MTGPRGSGDCRGGGWRPSGGAKVAAVASGVGYESEAAFSRAFKKATGLSPGSWREARGSGCTRAPPESALVTQ